MPACWCSWLFQFFWQLGMIVVLPILMVAEKSLNYAVMGIHLPLLAVVVLLMVVSVDYFVYFTLLVISSDMTLF